MEIYGDAASGNCQKVKFTCDHLGLTYTWREVDVAAGATRTAEFLRLNPAGQVPVLALGDGTCLAQSNAIIAYLATGSPLLPDQPFNRAKVFEWLFWEQYSHEPYIAVCRYQMVYLQRAAEAREPWRVARGEQALAYLESRLEEGRWLVGDALSIADIALVAYTRLAPEGGFSLDARPNLRAWIARCEEALHLATP